MMSRNVSLIRTSIALTAMAVVTAAAQAGAIQSYSIQELVPAPGYAQSYAYGINDLGVAVGSSEFASPDFNGMATIWRAGSPTTLGTAAGGNYSVATCVNKAELIAGDADDGDIRPLASVFANGVATIIDTGGNNSHAMCVTEAGVIVGNYARGFGTTWKPTLWTEDPAHPGRYFQDFLPLYVDPTGADSYDYVYDSNQNLQIVGQVSSSQWSARGGYWNNDAAHTLSLLEPLTNFWSSYAFGINNKGFIVGNSDQGIFTTLPTLWSPETHVASALMLFPSETYGSAWKINGRGEIIGIHGAQSKAAVWINRRIYDVESLLNESGWQIENLNDINEVGQIVGYGLHNGARRGFVLTPNYYPDKDRRDR